MQSAREFALLRRRVLAVLARNVTQPEIPPEVQAFIVQHVHTVEAVEVLTLLHDHQERAVTADRVQETIRSSLASVKQHLEYLARIGVLAPVAEEAGAYRFAPADEVLARQVRGVVEAYRARRVSVLEFIYREREPTDRLRSFSDAFRLRPKP